MSSDINEQYLNQLIENFQNERTKLIQDFKNDKELKHKELEGKLNCCEKITKELIKYRNLIIKAKIKELSNF